MPILPTLMRTNSSPADICSTIPKQLYDSPASNTFNTTINGAHNVTSELAPVRDVSLSQGARNQVDPLSLDRTLNQKAQAFAVDTLNTYATNLKEKYSATAYQEALNRAMQRSGNFGLGETYTRLQTFAYLAFTMAKTEVQRQDAQHNMIRLAKHIINSEKSEENGSGFTRFFTGQNSKTVQDDYAAAYHIGHSTSNSYLESRDKIGANIIASLIGRMGSKLDDFVKDYNTELVEPELLAKAFRKYGQEMDLKTVTTCLYPDRLLSLQREIEDKICRIRTMHNESIQSQTYKLRDLLASLNRKEMLLMEYADTPVNDNKRGSLTDAEVGAVPDEGGATTPSARGVAREPRPIDEAKSIIHTHTHTHTHYHYGKEEKETPISIINDNSANKIGNVEYQKETNSPDGIHNTSDRRKLLVDLDRRELNQVMDGISSHLPEEHGVRDSGNVQRTTDQVFMARLQGPLQARSVMEKASLVDDGDHTELSHITAATTHTTISAQKTENDRENSVSQAIKQRVAELFTPQGERLLKESVTPFKTRHSDATDRKDQLNEFIARLIVPRDVLIKGIEAERTAIAQGGVNGGSSIAVLTETIANNREHPFAIALANTFEQFGWFNDITFDAKPEVLDLQSLLHEIRNGYRQSVAINPTGHEVVSTSEQSVKVEDENSNISALTGLLKTAQGNNRFTEDKLQQSVESHRYSDVINPSRHETASTLTQGIEAENTVDSGIGEQFIQLDDTVLTEDKLQQSGESGRQSEAVNFRGHEVTATQAQGIETENTVDSIIEQRIGELFTPEGERLLKETLASFSIQPLFGGPGHLEEQLVEFISQLTIPRNMIIKGIEAERKALLEGKTDVPIAMLSDAIAANREHPFTIKLADIVSKSTWLNVATTTTQPELANLLSLLDEINNHNPRWEPLTPENYTVLTVDGLHRSLN